MPAFDDLLTKLARGEKLDALELEQFRQESRALNEALQFVTAMNQPGFTYARNLRIDTKGIEADGTILHPFVAEKVYHASDTPIANNTFVDVTFNQNKYGNSAAFRLDDGNQKIHLLTKAKAFFATLAHGWQANSTGVRRVDFQYYDASDVLIGTALLQVVPGTAVDETWHTATRLADLPDQTAYIKCRVKQTSGGSLNLVYFACDLHVV